MDKQPELEFKSVVRRAIERIQRNAEKRKGVLLSPREVECMVDTLLAEDNVISED